MEGGSSSASYDPTNESHVLDVQPLRTLTPIYPGPYGFSAHYSAPNAPTPVPSVNPVGSPPVFTPVFPSFGHDQTQTTAANQTPKSHTLNGSQAPASAATATTGDGVDSETKEHADAIRLASSDAPPQPAVRSANGVAASVQKESPDRSVRRKRTARKSVAPPGSFAIRPIRLNDENGNKRRKPRTPNKNKALITGGNLMSLLAADAARESVEKVLMICDGLRRRFSQIDDMDASIGVSQPGLRAGSSMTSNGIRVNATKRVGAVPGVEIGDLFFFRYEMGLIGLHAPLVAGIDYMIVKSDKGQEPIATSIVSSGVYEDDDMDDSEVLIYTGHGGSSTPGKHMVNQKLEKGNLALERSWNKGNEIRVIRGVMDIANPKCKIYLYDGLYKVQESWTEKGKAGFNVFKFKLVRLNGQPEGSAFWKRIQQWKGDPSSRPSVILPDISSGIEKIPVCLVNEVDSEKGPAHFSYAVRIKYVKPVDSVKSLSNCDCSNSCSPVGPKCSCKQTNGGFLPYTSNGLLVNRRQLIYECGSCRCSINCRNRVTQKGINLRFEVFKTKDMGWGLRSWDPIRAGSFICEFVGEVCDYAEFTHVGEENNYLFDGTSSSTENLFEWNHVSELLGEEKLAYSDGSLKPLSIVINAKSMGNISRFMNHSCSPNVFWQPVMYDHGDEHHPHIMFFAFKHIPPMTELVYDYGLRGTCSQQKKCLCGSSKCKGFFFS